MNILPFLIRVFIYYQMIELAALAGVKGSPLLLIVDIAIAYIILMYLWPVFPPQNNNDTNNTGG